jgi:hypothetical protein
MRALAKFGVVLLAFLIAGVPVVACMLPGTSLSAEEQACCREMANQCGGDQMPSSHPCCKTVGPTDHNALAKSSFKLVRESHTLYLLLPTTQVAELPQHAVSIYEVPGHAPPELPLASPEILRI